MNRWPFRDESIDDALARAGDAAHRQRRFAARLSPERGAQ